MKPGILGARWRRLTLCLLVTAASAGAGADAWPVAAEPDGATECPKLIAGPTPRDRVDSLLKNPRLAAAARKAALEQLKIIAPKAKKGITWADKELAKGDGGLDDLISELKDRAAAFARYRGDAKAPHDLGPDMITLLVRNPYLAVADRRALLTSWAETATPKSAKACALELAAADDAGLGKLEAALAAEAALAVAKPNDASTTPVGIAVSKVSEAPRLRRTFSKDELTYLLCYPSVTPAVRKILLEEMRAYATSPETLQPIDLDLSDTLDYGLRRLVDDLERQAERAEGGWSPEDKPAFLYLIRNIYLKPDIRRRILAEYARKFGSAPWVRDDILKGDAGIGDLKKNVYGKLLSKVSDDVESIAEQKPIANRAQIDAALKDENLDVNTRCSYLDQLMGDPTLAAEQLRWATRRRARPDCGASMVADERLAARRILQGLMARQPGPTVVELEAALRDSQLLPDQRVWVLNQLQKSSAALSAARRLTVGADLKNAIELIRPDASGKPVEMRLNVGVTGRDSLPILNLKREEFVVEESGARQKVTAAQIGAASPFNVALLVDVSGRMDAERPFLAEAARTFVDALAPDSKVAIVAFNETTSFLVNSNSFTSDRTQIDAAIAQLATQRDGPASRTNYYRSVYETLKRLIEPNAAARNALVVISANHDNMGTWTNASLLGKTQASAALIYAVQLQDGRETTQKAELESLANASGGRYFMAISSGSLGGVLEEVADELQTVYTLVYSPTSGPASDGKQRDIKVRTIRLDGKVRHRASYSAVDTMFVGGGGRLAVETATSADEIPLLAIGHGATIRPRANVTPVSQPAVARSACVVSRPAGSTVVMPANSDWQVVDARVGTHALTLKLKSAGPELVDLGCAWNAADRDKVTLKDFNDAVTDQFVVISASGKWLSHPNLQPDPTIKVPPVPASRVTVPGVLWGLPEEIRAPVRDSAWLRASRAIQVVSATPSASMLGYQGAGEIAFSARNADAAFCLATSDDRKAIFAGESLQIRGVPSLESRIVIPILGQTPLDRVTIQAARAGGASTVSFICYGKSEFALRDGNVEINVAKSLGGVIELALDRTQASEVAQKYRFNQLAGTALLSSIEWDATLMARETLPLGPEGASYGPCKLAEAIGAGQAGQRALLGGEDLIVTGARIEADAVNGGTAFSMSLMGPGVSMFGMKCAFAGTTPATIQASALISAIGEFFIIQPAPAPARPAAASTP